MAAIGKQVRKKYPDVLFVAETPYQYGSQHPHATAYRIVYGANPTSCDYADMVLFRNTGPLNASEQQALSEAKKRTGQRFILTYRTYSDWDLERNDPAFSRSAQLYASQAAQSGNGFGFYSWNEMVDVHVAFSASHPKEDSWTLDRSERAVDLLGEMAKQYRDLVSLRPSKHAVE